MDDDRNHLGQEPSPDELQDELPDELDGILRQLVEETFAAPVPERAMERALERFAAVAQPSVRRGGRLAWLVPLAGVAAVVFLVMALTSRDERREEPGDKVAKVVSVERTDRALPEAGPTLGTYHLALRQSPEAAIALVEESATALAPLQGPRLRVGPLRREDMLELENWEEE